MTAFGELAGVERVKADAASRGLDIEVIDRPAARSLEEAAELMGIMPGDIVKSLVVKRSDDTYVFALVPGGRKISWPKLRGLLGVNKLQLPDASLALAATWATGAAAGVASPPRARLSIASESCASSRGRRSAF